ncbi:MAG TPA: DUF4192 domain-containing protein [Promicromonospora sp.]|nr:DUF4192 domain-containing protein [Promicromonospora sp.]
MNHDPDTEPDLDRTPDPGGPGPAATVVRVAGPEDLLSYIPYRLGFRPAESVVAVSLTGPRRRVGLVARVDIDDLLDDPPADPPTAGPATPARDGAATARWLTDHVVEDGADRAVVVLYSDDLSDDLDLGADAGASPSRRPRRAAEVLRRTLERRLPGVEVWVVTSTGFRALDCTDPLCCPPGGRPLSLLTSSRVAAHMVLAGRTVAGTREERYALRPAPEVARTQARRAAARWAAAYERIRTGGPTGPGSGAGSVPGAVRRGGSPAAQETDRDALARWGEESLGLWRSAVRQVAALGPGETCTLRPATLGKIGAALADTSVRDAVLLSLAPNTREAALRTARHEADAATDAATADVMARIVDPVRGVVPDTGITGPARTVLEAVATHVPRARRAPAYVLLALLAWWHGDGGLAAERVSDALGVDPTHRLAGLLRSAIAGGVPPGWVRRERDLRCDPGRSVG